jgi:hypothetical protein
MVEPELHGDAFKRVTTPHTAIAKPETIKGIHLELSCGRGNTVKPPRGS